MDSRAAFLCLAACAAAWVAVAEESPLERFALTEDRQAVLDEMTPGTEEYYYLHALHLEHQGRLDEIPELLDAWQDLHGRSPRYREIVNRLALRRHAEDPEAAYQHLRNELGLRFPHQRPGGEGEQRPSSQLDPARISREAFLARAAATHSQKTTGGVELMGLHWLIERDLHPEARRHLLGRLDHPDHPGLVEAIAEDLEYERSGGFGSMPIHTLLTREQLDALAKRLPPLRSHANYVRAYLLRLQPNPDVDWRNEPEAEKAYLERLETFAMSLSDAFLSLQAHVLYHRLRFDLRRGVRDRERFMTYLKLPRHANYMTKEFLSEARRSGRFADLDEAFQPGTLYPAAGNDEALVRGYLYRFMLDDGGYEAFEGLVEFSYLERHLARVMLLHGEGDAESLYAVLSPAERTKLRDEVMIEFCVDNPPRFSPDEPVSIDAWVKNVDTLIAKVFEIDTVSYYQRTGKEVGADVDLEGLVANAEEVHVFDAPPIRAIRRTFDFPAITGRGVYVIELVGNGISSRSVVRKGRLTHVERVTEGGHVFTVLDEGQQAVKDAALWLDGHRYEADQDGVILVPFTNAPRKQSIVLIRDGFASLSRFNHQAEAYRLEAGFYVDPESLRPGRMAEVVVRPALYLGATRVSHEIIEAPRLTITALTWQGVPSTVVARDVVLKTDEALTYAFQVPELARSLRFTLEGEVRQLSRGEDVPLQASQTIQTGLQRREHARAALYLSKREGGYVIEARGLTGEPLARARVQTVFWRQHVEVPIAATLITDDRGLVYLDALEGIEKLEARCFDFPWQHPGTQSWQLNTASAVYPQRVHGVAGETIRLPYSSGVHAPASGPKREEFSLMEMNNGVFVRDRFDALRLEEGYVVMSGLPRGDYALRFWQTGDDVRIRLTDGGVLARHAVSGYRRLELNPPAALQILGVEDEGDDVVIRVAGAGPEARVHAVATRFWPVADPFAALNGIRITAPTARTEPEQPSAYVSGRTISDEHQYIIDRKYARKFPGNMLDRPSLLLNPWERRETETGQDEGAAGEPPRPAPPAGSAVEEEAASEEPERARRDIYPIYDFLTGPSPVFLNLKPAEDGTIAISRDELAGRHLLHVVAADPANTVYRSVSVGEPEAAFADTRLKEPIAPESHAALTRGVTALAEGDSLTIDNLRSSRVETYGALADVHRLFMALSPDNRLAEFSFAARWPELTDQEQRRKYAEYACHELNLFLYFKDPDFFESTVRPFLASKKEKQFIDKWLLGHDLHGYLKPWPYNQLNVVEQTLLAERLEAERAAIAGRVENVYELLPPDDERFVALFRAALLGNALQASYGAFAEELAGGADFLYDVNGDGVEEKIPYYTREDGASVIDSRFLSEAIDGAVTALPQGGVSLQGMVPMHDAMDGAHAVGGIPGGGFGGAGGGGFGGGGMGMPGASAKALAVSPPPQAQPSLPPEAAARMRHFIKRREGEAAAEIVSGDMMQTSGGAGGRQAGVERFSVSVGAPVFAQDDLARRGQARAFYQAAGQTKEWVENHYYRLPMERNGPGLIPVNRFWRDYVTRDRGKPFLSENAAFAANSLHEAMLALAVLDLPFEDPGHDVVLKDNTLTFNATGPLLVFHEEIEPVVKEDGAAALLVSQDFFAWFDRYEAAGGQRVDKFVTDEFLVDTVYGAQVTVTNPSSAPRHVDVLLQVPEGAVPVGPTDYTDSQPAVLGSYQTQSLTYAFYFPNAGDYAHFPVHVSSHGALLASAEPFQFHVVETPATVDRGSWAYVVEQGDEADVLDYLREKNLFAVDLDKMAWRLKDKEFFDQALGILDERHVYNETAWSYGVYHRDPARTRQYLDHKAEFVAQCGPYFDSELLTVDPVVRRFYQHMEYDPFINARAHPFGGGPRILNDRLFSQYMSLMNILAHKARLSGEDRLAVTYYLLLQERIEEALGMFEQITPEALDSRMPYDYLAAYLAFYRADVAAAEEIAARYAEYPVPDWRKRFEAVLAQAAETRGEEAGVPDEDGRDQRHDLLAATEPSFDFEVEGKEILLRYQNLESITVRFYLMDIELLFSSGPFEEEYAQQFSIIKPNAERELSLDAGQTQRSIALPPEFESSNIMIEARGAGMAKSAAYYANRLAVQVIENYGHVRVTHAGSGAPLPGVYVKVYARGGGGASFYKDGYTDLRGRFDYASLTRGDLGAIDRFALLILSEEHGATVRQAAPPKQ